jgi:hypothetical protein
VHKYYNEDRPHGAIGNKPPASLMTPAGASSPPAWQKPENSTFRRSNNGERAITFGLDPSFNCRKFRGVTGAD